MAKPKRYSADTGAQVDDLERRSEEPISKAEIARRKKKDFHKKRLAAYRGIPPALQERVKESAQALGVPTGQLVRACLEHALAQLDAGTWEPEPVEVRTVGYLYAPE